MNEERTLMPGHCAVKGRGGEHRRGLHLRGKVKLGWEKLVSHLGGISAV